MRSLFSMPFLIGGLGILICTGAITSAANRYVLSTQALKDVGALAPIGDKMAESLESVLASQQEGDLIIREIRNRNEVNTSLHALLMQLTVASKADALRELLLWSSAGVLFGTLLICHVRYTRIKIKEGSDLPGDFRAS